MNSDLRNHIQAATARQSQDALPERKKLSFARFSLRTMFILLTVFGLWFGWLAKREGQQRVAAERIKQLGGKVYYTHQLDSNDFSKPQEEINFPGPTWLSGIIDHHFTQTLVTVDLDRTNATDEDILMLSKRLPHLRFIRLNFSKISDESIRMVSEIETLEWISFMHTEVTAKGAEHLCDLPAIRVIRMQGSQITKTEADKFKTSKPDCVIEWSPPTTVIGSSRDRAAR